MLLLTSGELSDAPSDDSLIAWDAPVESGDRAINKFRDACGAVAPIRLRVSGPGISGHRDIHFESSFVIIGRSQKADLQLSHPEVSLRQVYLQVVSKRLYCIDLEDRSGPSGGVGGHGDEILAAGASFCAGPYKVKILDEDDWDGVESVGVSDSKVMSLVEGTDELARVTVEVLNCADGERYRAIEDAITLVGNTPGCQFRFKDQSISKVHCALVRTPESLWCVDLLGRQGTRLNGDRIRIGNLSDEDFLRIGRAKIRVHYSTPMIDDPNDDLIEKLSDEETVRLPGDTEQIPQVPESAGQETESDQMLSQSPVDDLPLPAMFPPPAAQLPQVPEGQLPAERNVSEAFVMTLINQFGQMQQQMFQQSQQSMIMLVNMFSALHQNHMDLIRDDLNRLHEITSELQSVQSQLVAGQSATNVSFTREMQREVDASVQDAVITTDAGVGKHSDTAPHVPADSVSESPVVQPRPLAAGKSDPEADQRAARSDRSGVKTHALLSERLAALENERDSRWKKIMQTIKGVGGA